ncbi:hypothetical protein C8R47DRAFT_1321761 [Mycena vitilis]|nr:hypothetical protein C8R47DRAFT_1321761 [Mycena vitilis]
MPRLAPAKLKEPSEQYYRTASFKLYGAGSLHKADPLHEAGPPLLGAPKGTRFFLSDVDRELEAKPGGRFENCVLHNLLFPSASATPDHEITLSKPLAVGLSHLRCAQVWEVTSGAQTFVARFYDPLYAVDDSGRLDMFLNIDKAISTEVAAFDSLVDLQGVIVPRFLGCFITTLIGDGFQERRARTVRVTLLEFVHGQDLFRLMKPSNTPATEPYTTQIGPHMCKEHKEALTDAALIAYHLMVLRGVHHMDFMGRNILLKETVEAENPFCKAINCILRFKISTEFLPQHSREPTFDYSQLSAEQLLLLPVAIIDFEGASCRSALSERAIFLSRPANTRERFVESWSDSDWLSN